MIASEWVALAGGGLLLYFGAEWFVGGASTLALALRVPQLLIGLTVVAYGTSAPEVIVGVQAASAGHGDVALGNVIGSNIANIGLILGGTTLLRPPRVSAGLARRELPMFVASAGLLPVLLIDGSISRLEGGVLLGVALLYTVWMIRSARGAAALSTARADAVTTSEAADEAGAPKPGGKLRAAITAVVGLAVLLVGGDLFVDGAVAIARSLGMSDRLVGLTIVAVGTSLPELMTSLIAARRGRSDITIGNVIGSNIFNTFLCLGAAALAGAIEQPLRVIAVDVVALLVGTLITAALVRAERTIPRREGALLLLLYAVFLVITISRR